MDIQNFLFRPNQIKKLRAALPATLDALVAVFNHDVGKFDIRACLVDLEKQKCVQRTYDLKAGVFRWSERPDAPWAPLQPSTRKSASQDPP